MAEKQSCGEMSIAILSKGNEKYVFLYHDETKEQAIQMLWRFASNPELSFNWYDAAILCDRIRKAAAGL